MDWKESCGDVLAICLASDLLQFSKGDKRASNSFKRETAEWNLVRKVGLVLDGFDLRMKCVLCYRFAG